VRAEEKALRAKALAGTDHAATKLRAPLSSPGGARCEPWKSSDACQALIASGIFSRTNPEAVSDLAKQLESEQFPPGCIVSAQSDFGGRLYIIISGKVKASYRRPDGCEIVLMVLGPSEMFGAIALFDPGSRRGMSVTALTEVLAVSIEHDQLLVWMAERPEVSDQVLRLFARRAKAATKSLVDFAFADAQSRIASRLLLLSKRFGRQEDYVVRVMHDLTLDDFSLLVGVAPKTTYAALREFEQRGWIRLEDNSVVIVDAQALASCGQ
jgi:CRP/FNR family cyclic AMP-dependent transcriptional regulator